MRGYKLNSYLILSPLPNPLPEGEGVNGAAEIAGVCVGADLVRDDHAKTANTRSG